MNKENLKFKSVKEMLDIIQSGIDLYNIETEQYVFLYNEKGAVAVYNIANDEAEELDRNAKENDEYWGAYLGTGGRIYDEPLEYCKTVYNNDGWVMV